MDVHICSVGGVGSTEFSNFLNVHNISTNLLNDSDGLRHCNRPPTYANPWSAPRTVVYIFGDPLNSVASHYHRNQAYHQALKTTGVRLREDMFPTTFEDYVSRGEDLMGIEAHFENWMKSPTSYDVVFVRYESLFDAETSTLLIHQCCCHKKSRSQLEEMCMEWVSRRRARTSQVPDSCRHHLYRQLTQTFSSLPPVFIRRGNGDLQQLALAPSALADGADLLLDQLNLM